METQGQRRPGPAQPNPAANQQHQANNFNLPHNKRTRSKVLGWFALGIAVVVIAGLVMLASTIFGRFQSGGLGDVKKDKYQAVFLNNNQVYFGKIDNINDKGITLKNIYYLQVQQNVQPDDKSKNQQQEQQLSLAKLGGELHGPEDVMYINRDQVLFWENLKDDGKVVQAIKNNSK